MELEMFVNCKICEKEFKTRTKRGKYCSEECRHAGVKKSYHKRLYKKNCKYCNNAFLGKKKEILCKECKGSRKVDYKTKTVGIYCPNCEEKTCNETRMITNTSDKKYGNLCKKCKKESNKKRSKIMSKNNPMHCPKTRAKQASSVTGEIKYEKDYIEMHSHRVKMTKEELSRLSSERMSKNNPMHKEEVKNRVSKTLKEKYKNGSIKKVTGSDHWLWKGNRERSKVIRSRLYNTWIRPILERDNFTCCRCKKSGIKLEVHHVDASFQSVIDEFLNGKLLREISETEFEILSEKVLERHLTVQGITYCVECHKDIDPLRR